MKRTALAIAFLLLALSAYGAMSKAEAKKLLAEYGLPETGDGMLSVLNTSMPDAPKIVEAYLVLGVRADKAITYETSEHQTLTQYPLKCAQPEGAGGATDARPAAGRKKASAQSSPSKATTTPP